MKQRMLASKSTVGFHPMASASLSGDDLRDGKKDVTDYVPIRRRFGGRLRQGTHHGPACG
jgi:hypothetical protein